jgi:hypothetical protein
LLSSAAKIGGTGRVNGGSSIGELLSVDVWPWTGLMQHNQTMAAIHHHLLDTMPAMISFLASMGRFKG